MKRIIPHVFIAGIGASYAYSVFSPLLPLAAVTTTLTGPGAPAEGTVAVMRDPLTTMTSVAATPPNVTPATPEKFVPVIVTLFPPFVEPEAGATRVTVGGGRISWTLSRPMTSCPFTLAPLMNLSRIVVPAMAVTFLVTVNAVSAVSGVAVQYCETLPATVGVRIPGIDPVEYSPMNAPVLRQPSLPALAPMSYLRVSEVAPAGIGMS